MRTRGMVVVVAAFALMTPSAHAFQVGIFPDVIRDNVFDSGYTIYEPELNAAPWEVSDVTMRESSNDSVVTFHDPVNIIGKNPPQGWLPCKIVDSHTARCARPADSLYWGPVTANLSDRGATYVDLAAETGSGALPEVVFSGAGNDNVTISHGPGLIRDSGGINVLRGLGAANHTIWAYNGVHNQITVRNGHGGDVVHCYLGPWDQGPNVAEHGLSDTVSADSGDTISGCENDLP